MKSYYLKNSSERFLSTLKTSVRGFTPTPKSLVWGFTLIELLVTVLILGVLVSVAVPIFRNNVKRVMATEGYALVSSIKTAQKIYFIEHNEYTSDWEDLNGNIDIDKNKYFNTKPELSAEGVGDNSIFVATVTGSGEASGISISIDNKGTITTTGLQ
jgi:type IV pilus assembly protein PilE